MHDCIGNALQFRSACRSLRCAIRCAAPRQPTTDAQPVAQPVAQQQICATKVSNSSYNFLVCRHPHVLRQRRKRRHQPVGSIRQMPAQRSASANRSNVTFALKFDNRVDKRRSPCLRLRYVNTVVYRRWNPTWRCRVSRVKCRPPS